MKHVLTAAVEVRQLFPIIFTEIFQTNSALSDLTYVVLRVVIIGPLVQKPDESIGDALDALLVFSDESSLASGDSGTDDEGETPHEHANEHVKKKSNANHPDEETIHVQVLFVFLLQGVHLVDQGDAVDCKAHKNHLKQVRSFNEELVILSEDERDNVVRNSE
jgi:hypothetical protein